MKRTISLFITTLSLSVSVIAQERINVGAEIWIEPGQTEQQIDNWFSLAAQNGMKSARLFLMWNYIESEKGKYDFKLYDIAFDAAERYGLEIEATLCAIHGPAHLDKSFFGRPQFNELFSSERVMKASASYIKACVTRYSGRKSLGCWWVLNEPRRFNPQSPLATSKLHQWLKDKYSNIENLNRAWLTSYSKFTEITYNPLWEKGSYFHWPSSAIDWYLFQRDFLTWNLEWIVTEIKKWDNSHEITMNPANIFESAHLYNLPAYRKMFDIYGASMHAAWQLCFLPRNCYGFAVGGICDILKGAAPDGRFWISEMQGGNNIWSGKEAMCPDSNDLAQWVWTGIGTGARKVIYWALNYRKKGIEAGEWGLCGFKGESTDRSQMTAKINSILDDNADFFRHSRPSKGNITLVISPETMRLLLHIDAFNAGAEKFDKDAHILSLMTWYVALCECGHIPEIKYLEDYDWESEESRRTVILSDAIGIPDKCIERMKSFVHLGNTLIAEGLTGFFDDNETNRFQQKNDFEELFGGILEDLRMKDSTEIIHFYGIEKTLSAYKWIPIMKAESGKAIAIAGEECCAIENHYGAGKTIWIPACISMGTDISDPESLRNLIEHILPSASLTQPFYFAEPSPGIMLRILESGKEYITVLCNNKTETKPVTLVAPVGFKPKVIFGKSESTINERMLLTPKETIVIRWTEEQS